MNLRNILTFMSPSNLRTHNIRALESKETLTDAEANMLADMRGGGAGSGGSSVNYAEAWNNKGY